MGSDGRSPRFAVATDVAEAVLAGMDLAVPPPPTLDGLTELYRVFCRAVPFDNSPKLAAVRRGDPIPGADPDATLRDWLRDGRGGSCWALAGALAALAEHSGLDAWCSLERRPAANVDLHGATVVRVEDELVLCDPLWQSDRPLRLSAANAGSGGDASVSPFAPRVRPEAHRWRHLVRTAVREVDYTVLSLGLDQADVAAVVELTRTNSNINDAVWMQRPDGATSVSVRAEIGSDVATVRRFSDGSAEVNDLPVADAFAAVGVRAARIDELRRFGLIA